MADREDTHPRGLGRNGLVRFGRHGVLGCLATLASDVGPHHRSAHALSSSLVVEVMAGLLVTGILMNHLKFASQAAVSGDS